MTITNWPTQERPREKLLQHGAQTLSDAELLAIFLRTGVKGKTAVDLARELLSAHGLRGILAADQQTFCQYHGVGNAKYVMLQACLELARRHLYTELQRGPILDDAVKVSHFLLSQLRHRQQEIFSGLFLDAQNRLLAYEELFVGTVNKVIVHPRELLKRVLAHQASGMIIAHNHPSGEIKPSREDKQLTSRLQEVLALIDVKLLDHFIVGDQQVFSFAQEGLLI